MIERIRDAHPHDEVVMWLERIELQQRGLDATRLQLIAASLDQVVEMQANTALPGSGLERELAYRSLRAELALALNQSEHQTEMQMNLAHALLHAYPLVFRALEEGRISSAQARVIVDAGEVLGPARDDTNPRRQGYEAAVLGSAARETPNRLRPIARRLAEQWSEFDLEQRHRVARRERRVAVVDRDDGMADLIAHLPALEAYAIHDRLTRIARAAERGERTVREQRDERVDRGEREEYDDGSGNHGTAESRSRDEMRADAFTDLLLAADERTLFAGTALEAIRGQVQFTLECQSYASGCHDGDSRDGDDKDRNGFDGWSLAAAELGGYGPISVEVAGRVAGHAPEWNRVVTAKDSPEVLRVDRYRPSEAMRRLLGARDQRCRFPGCRMPVHRCDLDHTIDAALGGPTTYENLAHLCRGHHTLKHHSDWRVRQEPGGVLRWTSPTGRTYTDQPITRQLSTRQLSTAQPSTRQNIVSCGSFSSRSPRTPGEVRQFTGRCTLDAD